MTVQLNPRLFLEMASALQRAYEALTDPYLGEDDGERQESVVRQLRAALDKLVADEAAMTLLSQGLEQIQDEIDRLRRELLVEGNTSIRIRDI